MGKYPEVIRRRSVPVVFMFDLEKSLVYVNKEAVTMCPGLKKGLEGFQADGKDVDAEICLLLNHFNKGEFDREGVAAGTDCLKIMKSGEDYLSLQVILLGNPEQGNYPTHVMLLVSKVIEKHEVDLYDAGLEFSLSKRELEVLGLIVGGLTTRKIADTLFICELTVKDHIKKIMRKMGVRSRGEIVAILK